MSTLIDQSVLGIPRIAKAVQSSLSRVTIGFWFLLLIIVSCAYKSKLMSSIVVPKFHYPPRTFLELENSDYKIGALFWVRAVEDQFIALDNHVGRSITSRSRSKEYPYIDNNQERGLQYFLGLLQFY